MTIIKKIYFPVTSIFLLVSAPGIAMQPADDIPGHCFYTIKNREVGDGYLNYTNKKSADGRYVQHLHSGSNYDVTKQRYEPGGIWENGVRWYISPSEVKGYYTIRNFKLSDGYLCYTNDKSPSGHYVQHLHSGSNYDSTKDHYKVGGKYRESVLWAISPAENGCYTIKNYNFNAGYLSYTYEGSASGHYVQHLYTGSLYDGEKQHYEVGGKWRDSVLWDLKPEKYNLKAVIKDFKFTTDPLTILSQNNNKSDVILSSKTIIDNKKSSAQIEETIEINEKTRETASLNFQKSTALDFSEKFTEVTAEISLAESKELFDFFDAKIKTKTSATNVIEWNCKKNSQTSRSKTFTSTKTHRFKKKITVPARTSVAVYSTISRSTKTPIPFTYSIKITAFADRLNKNGTIDKKLPVDVDLVKFLLKREGYHAPIIRIDNNAVYVTVNGELIADVGFDTLIHAEDL